MSCVAPAPNLCGLSHYFPGKIYRSAEVKKNFAQDLAEWHASVKLWIESVNEQVDIWNKSADDGNIEKYYHCCKQKTFAFQNTFHRYMIQERIYLYRARAAISSHNKYQSQSL